MKNSIQNYIKIIFVSTFIIVSYFITPSIQVNAETLTKPLFLKVTDSEIKYLQTYLNNNGYIVATTGNGSPGKETTYFGQKTKQAVIKFQTANNMTSDGVVGPVVRAFINNQSIPPIVTPPSGVCTPPAVFNIITGEPCAGAMSVCGPGVLFNRITGASCVEVCAPGVLFNSVTGLPCGTLPPSGGGGSGGGSSSTYYTLNIQNSGGTGTGSYGGTSGGSVLKNTPVSITANPDGNSTFTNWTATGSASGCEGSTTSPCSFSMTSDASVKANYALNTPASAYTLTLIPSGGNGSGTYGGTQAGSIPINTIVSITASPSINSNFTGWTATGSALSCSETSNSTCIFVMTENATVQANYDLKIFTLNYTAGAGGSIVGMASQTVSYGESGSPVVATPLFNTHIFDRWSDSYPSANRVDPNVTRNILVEAIFKLKR